MSRVGEKPGGTRKRKLKARVSKRGTVVSKDAGKDNVTPSKRKVKSKNVGKNTAKRSKVYSATDTINSGVYPAVTIDSDSNKDGESTFNIPKAGLDKIVNLLSPMSNKVEKNFILQVTSEHLIASQEQEGVTAMAYIDVEFETKPKDPITLSFSKEAIKLLRDVTADFAQFVIYDTNLDIYVADTKLEMPTEDTSEIPTIEVDLDEFTDFEYMNADTVNNIFSRVKGVTLASAGAFEPTVTMGSTVSCGSEFYLTEVRDCFEKFEANCSPEFILYILNLAKSAKKKLKFAKTDDHVLVMNDTGMLYITHHISIKFPTDISNEFLPSNELLNQANFDTRVLMTSIQKLKIALLGTNDPDIIIAYNTKRAKADVSVSATSNKKSTDSWSAGDMMKKKVDPFSVKVALLVNTISILDENITMQVYEPFIAVSDDIQTIVVATNSE